MPVVKENMDEYCAWRCFTLLAVKHKRRSEQFAKVNFDGEYS